MMYSKRAVDLVVISDTHLGTYGCHAAELLQYLDSIQPKLVVLNGDIIDVWNFKKSYFPATHWAVIEKIIDWITQGVQVHYLTGNHDELMRRFSPLRLSNFQLEDKLLLDIGGKKIWLFHGDVFDVSIKVSKWLARLGGKGYDWLIGANRLINWGLVRLGYAPMSFSKKVKDSIKRAVKYIDDFERTAAELAIRQGYDFVVCGHIHQAQMRTVTTHEGSVLYLNSGDWIENLTALEYHNAQWTIYKHAVNDVAAKPAPVREIPSYERLIERITVSI